MDDLRRPRIVIVGAGFAGAYCAQALERRVRGRAEVVLLDRNNFFVFHPLLVEAGTGSLDPRHAVVAVRAFLRRTRFVMGEVTAIDLAERWARYRLPHSVEEHSVHWDQLVLAPGSVTRLPDVPGLREHGFQLKGMADAVALRDHAIQLLETADAVEDDAERRRLLHLVVVGANFSGVEVAGEFHAFLHRARANYPRVVADDIGVTLVELGPRILTALGPELGEYAAKHLARRGVRVELRSTVARIQSDCALLADGRRLDTRTVIWCAGIAPSPLLEGLELPHNEGGWLLCEPDLRVQGRRDVWAIGDCAVNPGPDGRPYPATAQHAVREAAHLAANLEAVVAGREPRPCRITNLGGLAALGCRTGVAEVLGLRLAGFPAWFLWRTVYLMKMPGLARRLRVALDWSLDLLLGREIVQLGLTRSGRGQGQRPRPPAPDPVPDPDPVADPAPVSGNGSDSGGGRDNGSVGRGR